jgi:hypothetical protein
MATWERRDHVPLARANVLRRHRSAAVGNHIHHSAPARGRVPVAECQRKEDAPLAAVCRHRGDDPSAAVCRHRGDALYRCHVLPEQADREAVRVPAVQRLADRAIRGRDSAQLHDQGKARAVPVVRGAAMGVREVAAAHRHKGRRNGEHPSSKRSQPAQLLFHHRFW